MEESIDIYGEEYASRNEVQGGNIGRYGSFGRVLRMMKGAGRRTRSSRLSVESQCSSGRSSLIGRGD